MTKISDISLREKLFKTRGRKLNKNTGCYVETK